MAEHASTGVTATVVDALSPPSADFADAVHRLLTAFLDAEAASLTDLDPSLEVLVAVARQMVLGGGKRLRSVFAFWGWRGAVGPDRPVAPVLPALGALELLHACALVHDDVMDDSATRRGLPTAHRAVAARHVALGWPGDPDEFGHHAAILIGDLCMVWADRLAGNAELPAATLLTAREGYDRMRLEAIAGQFLDLLGNAARDPSPVEHALRVARLKTASYTVVRPLVYGAMLGGATGDGTLARAYTRYGLAVGEAFQLRDDLLGVYGDPHVTGKPVGEDLLRGRSTVLVELARASATGTEATELRALLARRSPEDLPRLAALLARTGAVTQLNRMIAERVAHAFAAVNDGPLDPQTREGLCRLATAASQRSS
ncbi:polyprenyl synthetase family protein [Frankia sp. AgB1.9]|uniref:polyprenyl synthetase family protein n=1 Tax=unclassified Frankia TaxID=2632575 RepID=UPI0019315830|nr:MULTISPECIES: polyprenyl synthetase family protein [unclassified Frankia]MBL7488093.1 polyprenyl synthetase family protein [Frankia sp. AgW1.1]MBL7548320.1 polyprenyl synthetase family protein [Frankia sp. AgB1.9]MBL7625234.1 polyprenyl synthetase family protein [Frankia sp. AgB1.8]